MARSANLTSIAPASDTPAATNVIKTVGKFIFAVNKGVPVPEAVATRTVKNPLPFNDIFAGMEKGDHMFIPSNFWTDPEADGGRGLKFEDGKFTPQWEKSKLRDTFNAWRKKGGDALLSRALVLRDRKAGDTMIVDGQQITFAEPGVSMFMDELASQPAAA